MCHGDKTTDLKRGDHIRRPAEDPVAEPKADAETQRQGYEKQAFQVHFTSIPNCMIVNFITVKTLLSWAKFDVVRLIRFIHPTQQFVVSLEFLP